jgi:hypothetical protein
MIKNLRIDRRRLLPAANPEHVSSTSWGKKGWIRVLQNCHSATIAYGTGESALPEGMLNEERTKQGKNSLSGASTCIIHIIFYAFYTCLFITSYTCYGLNSYNLAKASLGRAGNTQDMAKRQERK